MTQRRLPSEGEVWTGSIGALARAYQTDESTMSTRAYALAEQIHRHYCLANGIVQHRESRPDQQAAISILLSLAGEDWWVVRGAELLSRASDDPTEG